MKHILLICFLFSLSNVFSQYIYTNPEPDIITRFPPLNYSSFYNIDINNDQIIDFKMSCFNPGGVITQALIDPYNNAAIIGLGFDDLADTLNLHDSIGSSNNWVNSSQLLSRGYNNGMYGPWVDLVNHFLGVRIIQGSDTLYGWIRIDDTQRNLYVMVEMKDFYISTVPNQTVFAGDFIAPKAEDVSISDVSDNKNGSDLRIDFSKALNEHKVEEYRVFVVKETEAGSFDLNTAENVLSGNYLSLIPNGTNFSDTLSSVSKDVDGDLIQELIPYRVFILSMTVDTLSIPNYLSLPSNTLGLYTYAENVKNVYAEDVSNSDITSDITISFIKISNESQISEYRIIAVKVLECDSFTLAKTNVLQPGSYQTVNCENSNYTISLSDNLNDCNGDPILLNTSYRFFVLTVANSINTTINTLSRPSNIVSISNPNYFKAGQTSGDYVHYFDFSPDYLVGDSILQNTVNWQAEDFYFDLNEDGINDFHFQSFRVYSPPPYVTLGTKIESLNNNSISVFKSGSGNIDTLRQNDMINRQLFWNSGNLYVSQIAYWPNATNWYFGIWENDSIRFVGLCVKTPTDTIYGWVRLKLNIPVMTIYDYAWQSTSTHYKNIKYDRGFRLYPNPASTELCIQIYSEINKENNLNIIDIAGRTVLSKSFTSTFEIIDISGLSKGIYTVKINTDKEILTKPLIIN